MATHLPHSGPHPTLRRLLLALTLLLTLPHPSHAADGDTFTYNGVNYVVLSEADKTCATKPGSMTTHGSYYSGDLILSDSTEYNGKYYKLIEISYNSFLDCSYLKSVVIPESVTTIDAGAFALCDGLQRINIPSSVKFIGSSAFTSCIRLEELHIADVAAWCKITFGNRESSPFSSIWANLFRRLYINESETTDIEIPTSVSSISDYAFYGFMCLTSVSIPSSVTEIGSSAFESCSGLTSMNISEGVNSIGENAFEGCTRLTSLFIPESVTSIGSQAFSGDILKPLKISGRDIDLDYENIALVGLETESVVKCRGAIYYDVTGRFDGEVQIFDSPYEISNLRERYLGVEFELSDNPYYEPEGDVDVFAYVDYDGGYTKSEAIPIDSLGKYLIKGLEIPGYSSMNYKAANYYSADYTLVISSIKAGETEEIPVFPKTFNTKEPSITISSSVVKQASVTINSINAPSDISGSADELGVFFNGKCYVYDGSPLTITGLNPNTEYSSCIYAKYGNRYVYAPSFTTKDILLSCTTAVGPTSAVVTGAYAAGDAVVESTWWDGNDSTETNGLTVTGLKPNTSYTHTFHLVTDNGYSKSKDVTFTTPALELSVSDTKGVSATKTIVTATTNISDAETSVGFQWKKNDAPSTLKPREAYAVIYNGQLEGSLNNLQSTYYDVRAFYKDADGTYYYSDWLTFDPTDFSYFDPTVHTYPMSVEANETVVLNGYALGGTDDILSQGFQYWYVGPDNGSESTMNTLAADDPVITTVEAAGQKMSATIGNLRPESVYAFRAFVKTASGYTYGEEQQFVTGDFNVSAIDEISADEADKEVVGYYNLTGLFSPRPYQGFNIVLYSDGSTRKMIIQ